MDNHTIKLQEFGNHKMLLGYTTNGCIVFFALNGTIQDSVLKQSALIGVPLEGLEQHAT